MTIRFVLDACSQNDSFVVKFLIEIFDLDVNERIENKSPLAVACHNESIELIDYLLEKGAKIEDWMVESTVEKGKFLLLFSFIYHGYDINANQGRLGILACQKEKFEIFEYLVERGYNLDAYGAQCLFWALDKKNQRFIEYLRSKGVVLSQENRTLPLSNLLDLSPSIDKLHLYLLRKVILLNQSSDFLIFYGVDQDNYSLLINQVSFKRKRLEIVNYPFSFFNHPKADYRVLYLTGQGSTFSDLSERIKRRRV